jgi:cell division septation protein DedD
MGRLIRISIYALAILVLYFFITSVIKSSNSKTKPTDEIIIPSDTTALDSTIKDTIQLSDTLTSDLITNEEIVGGKIDYDAVDQKIKDIKDMKSYSKAVNTKDPINVKPETNPTIKTEKTTSTIQNKTIEKNSGTVQVKTQHKIEGNDGSYMVMAGSYLIKENADKMVKKLKEMGFVQAKVIVFASSEYHSVVAVQYSSQSKAQEAVSGLKRKGIDAFVKIK